MAVTYGRTHRRWILPSREARVWCPAGRWGPRRTRAEECWSTVKAEVVYTSLLKHDASKVRPGAQGTATFELGREFSFSWEVRQNGVWRRGRVFLRCPRCSRRSTRLYIPTEHAWLACRLCWGLTYQSRTLQNYKNSLWGRGSLAQMFGTSQRDWAFLTTDERRLQRQRRSEERWAERRRLLSTHLVARNSDKQGR